jgi:tRNA-2-methylthio-N6-dimethylallyladenosine synthase
LKKLFIQTHGCQMNEYDSDRMADLLREARGYELVERPEDADLLLLNTCSIREKAQEKVFHQLGRWKALKAARPGLKIGVGGCVASQEGDAIVRRAPQVDVVFGPQTLHRLPELLDDVPDANGAERLPLVDVSFPEIEKFDRLPAPRAEGPTAFVSVMEGCSRYCSFCVVPYTRGEEVSRPVADVVAEIAALAAQGVREVNLLGQNVNAYRGRIDGDQADLAELIHHVAALDGIERIRYTTSHPLEFGDTLLEAYASVGKLVDHLHLPIQSGSDRILKLMKRGHTATKRRSVPCAGSGRRSACRPISSSVFLARPQPILRRRSGSSSESGSTCRSASYTARGRVRPRRRWRTTHRSRSRRSGSASSSDCCAGRQPPSQRRWWALPSASWCWGSP